MKPWLQARFPVDPNRAILFGHSAAGLFAARLLADSPGRFAGYLIASPSFQYDRPLIERLSRLTAPEGTRVFLSARALEKSGMVADMKAVAASLARPGSGCVVRSQVFEGLGHSESYLMLPLTAYPFLLPPKG